MCHNILVLKREEKSTEASETKFYLHRKTPKTGEMEGEKGKE